MTAGENQMPRNPSRARGRLLLLLGLIATAYAFVHFAGLSESLRPEPIRQAVQNAGWWGGLVYIGIFSVGLLLYVPPIIFVSAAVFAYGQVEGGALAFLGLFVAMCVNFLVGRAVGGNALAEIEQRWVRKLVARVEAAPIRTIVQLRLFMAGAPMLNYALSMTNLRLRDYAVGSALGVLIPVTFMIVFLDWAMAFFGVSAGNR